MKETLTLLKKRNRLSTEEKGDIGDYLAHCDRFKVSESAASAILNLQQKQQGKQQRFTQSQIHRMNKYVERTIPGQYVHIIVNRWRVTFLPTKSYFII